MSGTVALIYNGSSGRISRKITSLKNYADALHSLHSLTPTTSNYLPKRGIWAKLR